RFLHIMGIMDCSSFVIVVLLALIAASIARITLPTKIYMCETSKKIVKLSPGDVVDIYGPNYQSHNLTSPKQKCNITLQASNVHSFVNINCSRFGVKNRVKPNNCRHYLQINSAKYCVKETRTISVKYNRANLKFVTKTQSSPSGFICSAEVPRFSD
ncbi:unnamed protein product, partial [Meganyctiphanes norvegica]